MLVSCYANFVFTPANSLLLPENAFLWQCLINPFVATDKQNHKDQPNFTKFNRSLIGFNNGKVLQEVRIAIYMRLLAACFKSFSHKFTFPKWKMFAFISHPIFALQGPKSHEYSVAQEAL